MTGFDEKRMSASCEFSAIIPTFNRAHLIERAIESVLSQTVPPAQIIVVDDGSTDDTWQVCQRFNQQIQFVRQRNGGAARARNAGIHLAHHPWIAFLDSDDVWVPTHLERTRAAILETSGAAAFYFADMQMTAADGGGTLWESCGFAVSGAFSYTPDATDWMLLKRQPAMLQCSVFRTDLLRARGAFDEYYRVAEDTELFCRLGIGGPACAVNGVGCIQTSDDATQNRLTHTVSGRTEMYWKYYIRIWRSVFRHRRSLSFHQRKLIKFNLAESYVCLARLRRRSGRVAGVVSPLVLAAWVDPDLAIWLLRKRTSMGYAETLRD